MERTGITLTPSKVGEIVKICGWVQNRRDHGKIIFVDLRDCSGILQVVFDPKNKENYQLAESLRSEYVVEIIGEIKKRPKGMENEKIITGKVELIAKNLTILNPSKTPPFEIDSLKEPNEEVRLKYRYLDLRRERMKNNLIYRYKVIKFFRDYLDKLGFLEIETPILTKGTPEGAREFIVPARLWPGKFYVLPQSPQQFKQLLMVAGIEKYFQIARCFRDEDQRGDRQAEFTQLDLEMSFITKENILELVENLMIEMVKNVYPQKKISQIPFSRLSFSEAMKKYNSDKPDLRKDKNNPDELAFCWILDFPLFEYSETEGKLVSVHHPFTAPHSEDIDLLDKTPEKVRSQIYDLVLNGYEIFGGSIRIHQRDLQNKIFKILGLGEEEIQRRFGHLLDAFEYGAPPHGGIAGGLDRILAVLQNEPNIREVIPFPKTGDNRDLMMEAPNIVEEKVLRETHIRLVDEILSLGLKDESVFKKIKEFLDENKTAYELLEHKPVFTSRQAAKVRGTKLKQGARALIFKTDSGFIQAICPADRNVDENKLKEILKTQNLTLATEKEIWEATNCQIGAVPPFGNLFGLIVYVDKALGENEIIAFNAGMNTRSVKMKYIDWEKVVKPKLEDFS